MWFNGGMTNGTRNHIANNNASLFPRTPDEILAGLEALGILTVIETDTGEQHGPAHFNPLAGCFDCDGSGLDILSQPCDCVMVF